MFSHLFKICLLGLLSLSILAGCAVQPPKSPEKNYVYVGDNWRSIDSLTPPADALGLKVEAPENGALGDSVRFHVTPHESGYLWVLQVDSNDELTVLFPNSEERKHWVVAGSTRAIPGNLGDYVLYLGRPVGEQLLAFIVTGDKKGLQHVLPSKLIQDLYRRGELKRGKAGSASNTRWGVQKHHLTVRAH